jgi:hypothetical protein
MPPPPPLLLVAMTKDGLQGYISISMRECTFLCFKSIQFTLIGRKLDPSDLRDALVDLANDTPFKRISPRYNICRKTVKRIKLSMDLYVDEMIELLFDEHVVELSDRTLFRTLGAAKWTRKVAGKHADERNEALQAAFYNITRYWDPV